MVGEEEGEGGSVGESLGSPQPVEGPVVRVVVVSHPHGTRKQSPRPLLVVEGVGGWESSSQGSPDE